LKYNYGHKQGLQMKEIFIKTQKTARVFSENSENKEVEEVVIALHGYAQLASFFIKNFSFLKETNTAVYAPEGLSKFYWQGMGGRVVASWMTKEDRANEIIDQQFYLNSILDQIIIAHPKAKITVLGFSQGSATACRWISKMNHNIHRLIIWAGDIPEDALTSKQLLSTPIKIVLGDNDEFISSETAEKRMRTYMKSGFDIQRINYEGGHKIYPEILEKLF
jgi:predicted esterase